MKLVIAIIRPAKLDDVVDALAEIGADKLTVTEVLGIGRALARRPAQEDDPAPVAPTPKIEIEVAVSDEMLPRLLTTLRTAALTGKPGDGKIFVTDLQRAVRIRNGRTGDHVL
jgi:nitrogen regulatory protein PII